MILKCRSCGSEEIQSIVSLGFTPLANALLRGDQLNNTEEKFPLDLVFCASCSLVQIIETVPPEKLFGEYFYTSSVSTTTLENAKACTENLIERLKLDEMSTVVEIGSNDGYLLKNYVDKKIQVLGVEPAKNIAMETNKKGIRTINGFFGLEQAKQLTFFNVSASVVHANNVLAHVADLHSVIAGIEDILKPDGVAVIETHYVRDLIEKVEFDCVYHEHLCYYSAHSIKKLFEFHDMTLVDIERIPIHGGSLRVYFQRSNGPKSLLREGFDRVTKFLEEEKQIGMDKLQFYQSIGPKIVKLKHELLELLYKLKLEGKRICVYGVSAKSTTLLNYFGIDDGLIDFAVDSTPGKQGHYTPGMHLPIFPPEKISESMPDYALLLTWNFAEEILKKEKAYRDKGGKFIIPIPKLEVV